MLTLSVALGAGSASAATPATTGVTWHKLTLANGWTSASNYHTGDPSWAVKDGIVYLSGSVRQPTGTNNEVAILPKPARPARTLYITVYTLGETTGHVDIFPNGELAATSSAPANAQGFTSLAAISFPAASAARHRLNLINGWKSSQGAWHTGDPSYSVRGGIVLVRRAALAQRQ